jgi:hypothetical protein
MKYKQPVRKYADGGVAEFQDAFANARAQKAPAFLFNKRKYSTDVEKTDATDNAAVLALQQQMKAEKHYAGPLDGMATKATMVAYANAKDAGLALPKAVESALPMFMQQFHKSSAPKTATPIPVTTPSTGVLPPVESKVSVAKEDASVQSMPKTIGKEPVTNSTNSKDVMTTDEVKYIQTFINSKIDEKKMTGEKLKVDGKLGAKSTPMLLALMDAKDVGALTLNGKEVTKQTIDNTISASVNYAKKGSGYIAPKTNISASKNVNDKQKEVTTFKNTAPPVVASKDTPKASASLPATIKPAASLPATIGKKSKLETDMRWAIENDDYRYLTKQQKMYLNKARNIKDLNYDGNVNQDNTYKDKSKVKKNSAPVTSPISKSQTENVYTEHFKSWSKRNVSDLKQLGLSQQSIQEYYKNEQRKDPYVKK